MEPIYQKLSSEGSIFVSNHSSLNLNSKELFSHKFMISESFSLLLGKTLSDLQEMFMKRGYWDIFDF